MAKCQKDHLGQSVSNNWVTEPKTEQNKRIVSTWEISDAGFELGFDHWGTICPLG